MFTATDCTAEQPAVMFTAQQQTVLLNSQL